MTTTDDIPSLTLRVLQNIQGELTGLRGDVQSLNTRIDHLLGFVGRDVQDLRTRLTVVEQHLGLGQTPSP